MRTPKTGGTDAVMLELRHAAAGVLACLALAASAIAADLPTTFDPSRDAAADVAQAVALARSQGKRVIVDVGGEWCTWCHIMDRFIAANTDVRSLIDAHYVWVKVNFSKQNPNEAVLSRWPRVAGYPHLFVLDGSGRLVHSQNTSALESGKGYDKSRFLAFINRWKAKGAATSRT
jgi:thiol:disulfide interchange protein